MPWLMSTFTLVTEQQILAIQALERCHQRILLHTTNTDMADRFINCGFGLSFVIHSLLVCFYFIFIVLTQLDQLKLFLLLRLDHNYLLTGWTLDSVIKLKPVHESFLNSGYLDQVLVAGDTE